MIKDDTDLLLEDIENKRVEKLKFFLNVGSFDTLREFLTFDSKDVPDADNLTAIIKDNFLGWVKSGIILSHIKDDFMYHVGFRKDLKCYAKNWPEYCKKFIGKTHWYVNNIIEASKVVLILEKYGFVNLPDCESQARPLTRYLPDYNLDNDDDIKSLENEICKLWAKCLNYRDTKKNKILTANDIRKVVDPDSEKPPEKTIKINMNVFEGLAKIALDNGCTTVTDYFQAIVKGTLKTVHGDESIEPASNESLEQWENDLTNLVEEHDQVIGKDDQLIGDSEPVGNREQETIKEQVTTDQETVTREQGTVTSEPSPIKQETITREQGTVTSEPQKVVKKTKQLNQPITAKIGDKFIPIHDKKSTYTVTLIEHGVIYGKKSTGVRKGFLPNQIRLI